MIKIAIIYHSGHGHTEKLAKSVEDGCRMVEGVETKLISVEDPKAIDWDYVNSADAHIFGSPTYMGTISAPFKTFMDATSKIWFKQGWRDKLAGGFTNSGWPSGDKFNTMLQLVTFAAQHGMIWINPGVIPGNLGKDPECKEINRAGSFMGVMATSPFDQKADIAPPVCDLRTAELLGKRVAESAVIWKKGKAEA